MDIEKKYPLTQAKEQYVLLRWMNDLSFLEVVVNEEVIGTVSGREQLEKGKTFQSILGSIEIVFTGASANFDVIVDGYHCRNNEQHPTKQLKRAASYFWGVTGIAFLMLLIECWKNPSYTIIPTFLLIYGGIMGFFVAIALYVKMAKAAAYYFGLTVFGSATMFALHASVREFDLITSGFAVVMAVLLCILLSFFNHALQASKHNAFPTFESDDLLDLDL